MELKRKKGREYTLDEMMYLINYNFITGVHQEDALSFTISSTCFSSKEKRWIVCDSREDQDKYGEHQDVLPTYYGETTLEAVEKCFKDRKNHSIYRKDAKLWTT